MFRGPAAPSRSTWAWVSAIRAGSTATLQALETTQTVLALVSAASAATVVLGLGYLLTNAVWILRALHRPSPASSEVLGEALDEPRDTARR